MNRTRRFFQRRAKQDRRSGSMLKAWFATFICVGVIGDVNSVLGQVVIDTNTVIDADNSFPDFGIEVIDGVDSPTVVQVLDGGQIGLPSVVRGSSILTVSGGAMGSVSAQDSSTLNISGGELNVPSGGLFDGGDTIAARDNSTVNISGGRIGVSTEEGDWHAVHLFDGSIVNISGGEIVGEGDGAVEVWPSTIVNISGGYIHDSDVAVKNFIGRGTVNVSGGRIGDFEDEPSWFPFPNGPFIHGPRTIPPGIFIGRDGQASISGGEVDGISVTSGAAATISGGLVASIYAADHSEPASQRQETLVMVSGGTVQSLFADDFGVIEVHGSNLALSDGPAVLADGTAINAVAETYGSGQILLVPEPSTLVLLLVGMLVGSFRRDNMITGNWRRAIGGTL